MQHNFNLSTIAAGISAPNYWTVIKGSSPVNDGWVNVATVTVTEYIIIVVGVMQQLNSLNSIANKPNLIAYCLIISI